MTSSDATFADLLQSKSHNNRSQHLISHLSHQLPNMDPLKKLGTDQRHREIALRLAFSSLLIKIRREGHVSCLNQGGALSMFNSYRTFISFRDMGKCKGIGKLGRMARDGSVSSYQFSLMLSPIVSVWDCIVRKMRYSFRPEWV
ncbi:hypothetical protein M9H77_26660 [Catharanthus roseus]|uniref:Uncharacterized protein n=1 Tax=Catharanthus roseus TaxID=4058 RepID=A0ACC0AA98_CATRO|nr:hypothetical protein M9H77_26660 [Catharanthus roseus]